jgi:putative ABC transport system permease protein
MLHDIRLALRALVHAAGFSATTVLTLALAAGANAAIFAAVHGILLRPLPYREPDRLVSVWPGQFQSNADLVFTRDRGAMFASVASIAPGWTMALTSAGEPARVTIGRVSGNLFGTLGVRPILGRAFTEEAARTGRDRVIVLGHALWRTHFGADPAAVGRTVQLDGTPYTVVAVMPREFDVLGLESDAYTPLAIDEGAWYHSMTFSFFVARLADRRTLGQANRDYRALVEALRVERKQPADFGRTAALVELREALVGDVHTSLLVLAGAAGIILLIAGVNVGTLQMTRAAARGRDLAVRSALGASRGRLIRLVVAESAIVAAAAGALGVAAARVALPALVAILPSGTPRAQEIALDPLVAGAVVTAAVLVGLLVGLAPAVGITRIPTLHLLRSATGSESPAAKRTRTSLVSAEVALAVVLTIGAALMLRTLWNLNAVDPGFRADGVLTMHLQPTADRHRAMSVADYYDRLLERIGAVPGVTAAGAIQHLPFSGYSWTSPVEIERHAVPSGAALPAVEVRVVTPGYFAAMQQPIVAGRPIERADASRTDPVIVNEAFARRFFGSAAASLGRTLRTRGGRGPGPLMTIVGVAGDVRHNALTRAGGPEIYTSVGKNTIPAMMLAIRTSGDPRLLVPAVREAIRTIDPDVPLSNVQTMNAKVAASLGQPRLLLTLLGAFAALGVLLAAIGVYGVVAYSVAQRRKELGIMVALGAERGRIVRSVLRESLVYAAAGLAVGIPAALAARRVIERLVWGVTATDPITYAAIAVATLLLVVAAAMLPALRAAAVDPIGALKA